MARGVTAVVVEGRTAGAVAAGRTGAAERGAVAVAGREAAGVAVREGAPAAVAVEERTPAPAPEDEPGDGTAIGLLSRLRSAAPVSAPLRLYSSIACCCVRGRGDPARTDGAPALSIPLPDFFFASSRFFVPAASRELRSTSFA